MEKIQSWQDEGEGHLHQADLSWIHDSQIVGEEKWLPRAVLYGRACCGVHTYADTQLWVFKWG